MKIYERKIEETKPNANIKSIDNSYVHQIARSFLYPGGNQAKLPGTTPKVNKTSVPSHVLFDVSHSSTDSTVTHKHTLNSTNLHS